MINNRVNESSKTRRVNQVSHELSPLGDRATRNPSRGYSKRSLVQEVVVVEKRGRDRFEGEIMVVDEAIRRGAEGEGKVEEVVEEVAGSGVEDVEHGEAKLHGEDKVGGEEEVGGVDGVGGVAELVVDGAMVVMWEQM
ncbi:hypothetical protein Vadar_000007 [Vaccinium darrowii]|uniref:Uncharacterized protein n=1 Tax=Vaccinium darrowii TaxID=229202 RepID=A0ACB7YAX9_9ERIC|nr:hypothetical protein Vadar_000007 [Vaccinium darrowii]